MRTQQEIDAAIERLKENKKKCRPVTAMGDDVYMAIDAMIGVLEDDQDEDEIYAEYADEDENGEPGWTWDAAMSALEFKNGDLELEDILYPESI